jgi:hypothetical protein
LYSEGGKLLSDGLGGMMLWQDQTVSTGKEGGRMGGRDGERIREKVGKRDEWREREPRIIFQLKKE